MTDQPHFRLPEPGLPFVCSWSGGKDGCLALHRALAAGGRCLALVTMFDETGTRSRAHQVPADLIRAQAGALDLPLLEGRSDRAGYEAAFLQQLAAAKALGAEAVVFGDIDLEPHRVWEAQVCARAGLRHGLPLWLEARRPMVEETLGLGYRALLVAVRADRLGPEFLGRLLDGPLLAELEALGVDACGEEGEYHTLVVDGPRFSRPVAYETGKTHQADGHHFLELRPTP